MEKRYTAPQTHRHTSGARFMQNISFINIMSIEQLNCRKHTNMRRKEKLSTIKRGRSYKYFFFCLT